MKDSDESNNRSGQLSRLKLSVKVKFGAKFFLRMQKALNKSALEMHLFSLHVKLLTEKSWLKQQVIRYNIATMQAVREERWLSKDEAGF